MKRSTALALMGLFILGMGALWATVDGRRFLRNIAAAQLDDVLDTVAVTHNQRVALERAKHAVAAEVDLRVEQLRGLIECAMNSHARPRGRFFLGLPGNRPAAEIRPLPFFVRHSGRGACPSNGYLPPPRGAVAAEWRSCCSVAPR